MNLSGNEFKVYSYLLDKFQNVLDKYNNNIDISKVYHAESQSSISEKLHMSCRTLQNVLNSLCEKKLISVSCGKEFGEKNAYYMTDITQTDCYKQLDEKYKYEYELKKQTSGVSSKKADTSSSINKVSNISGVVTTYKSKLDDVLVRDEMCAILIARVKKVYSSFTQDESRRVLDECNNMTYRQFIEYIKIHYDIDISDLAY